MLVSSSAAVRNMIGVVSPDARTFSQIMNPVPSGRVTSRRSMSYGWSARRACSASRTLLATSSSNPFFSREYFRPSISPWSSSSSSNLHIKIPPETSLLHTAGQPDCIGLFHTSCDHYTTVSGGFFLTIL